MSTQLTLSTLLTALVNTVDSWVRESRSAGGALTTYLTLSMILSMIFIMDERLPESGEEVFGHAPDVSYLHLWREVILTYRQLMRRVAADTDYTGGQFEVLRQLAVGEGRSTVSALARELAVDPAAVTRLVAQLTELGLVERQTDARDGRRRPVVLTEIGRRRLSDLHTRLHEGESALTAGMDARSIETAMRVLRTMRNAVDSMPHRGPSIGVGASGRSR